MGESMTGDELRELIKEGGWSIKEFAKLVGMSEGGLRGALCTGKISQQLAAAARLAQRLAQYEKTQTASAEQLEAASEFIKAFDRLKNALN